MDKNILKKRVGNTPLVRAKSLEKELGIKKIFLKLEGNNPSGHREDRLAHLIIRDAITRGKKTICVGTFGTVGGSLAYLSGYYDVKCVFIVPNKKEIMRKHLFEPDYVEVIEFGRTYEDCVKESRHLSEEKGWYNANPGRANNILDMHAFSYVAEEIQQQIDDELDTVFCQTSNGSSISGLHLGFKQMWAREEINKIPRIFAASTAHGN
ncbi:MAG: pyridoxal-phosphate dependent enzyme, partial [Candidatus Thermoplasmatota archaeon]|nr:pyridoxal-phosphate dependent enzyme [Candidatus Thermoplasmatota archaeon]